MKLPALLAAFILTALAWALPAYAEAESGPSIALGIGNVTFTDPLTGQSEDQSVVDGGFDYQLALGGAFSLNVFLGEFGANDELKEIPNLKAFKVGHFGVQARVWFGALFVGAHAANYRLVTADDALSVSISDGSQGQGLVLGYEGGSGWFVLARTDQVEGLEAPDNGPKLDVSSTRLALGFRFK